MSTRATYKFNPQHSDKAFFIYVHYDNYPEGAAGYFHETLLCSNKRGGYGERFLRSNEHAEITDSHEIHGDTEYRYNLDNDGFLTADKSVWNRADETTSWSKFFDGSIWEFINQYHRYAYDGKTYENGEDWFQVENPNTYKTGKLWVCESSLKNQINTHLDAIRGYALASTLDNPNVASAKKEIDLLSTALAKHKNISDWALQQELRKDAA